VFRLSVDEVQASVVAGDRVAPVGQGFLQAQADVVGEHAHGVRHVGIGSVRRGDLQNQVSDLAGGFANLGDGRAGLANSGRPSSATAAAGRLRISRATSRMTAATSPASTGPARTRSASSAAKSRGSLPDEASTLAGVCLGMLDPESVALHEEIGGLLYPVMAQVENRRAFGRRWLEDVLATSWRIWVRTQGHGARYRYFHHDDEPELHRRHVPTSDGSLTAKYHRQNEKQRARE
jgi:hypothetical protein